LSKAKQVMMRPKKDIHYFEKQKKHIVNFIIRGSDVEVTVMFRKEEIPSQTEFGLDLLNLLADELSEIATVEAQPTLNGRNMTMIIKPGVSKALGDSDRNVRKSAAEVFHEIGDHASFEVHKAAAEPLGKIDDVKQIEKLLRNHFARITSELKLPPGADSPTTVFKDLLKSDCLTFTVDTIGQNLGRSLQQKQVLSDTAFIGEYFVAVTTCPWLNADEVRSHLSGGYVQFLDGLTKFSMGPNRKPIAHWIFCSNGAVHCAHLTLIPNPNTRVPTILATDLLGPSEKQQLNIT